MKTHRITKVLLAAIVAVFAVGSMFPQQVFAASHSNVGYFSNYYRPGLNDGEVCPLFSMGMHDASNGGTVDAMTSVYTKDDFIAVVYKAYAGLLSGGTCGSTATHNVAGSYIIQTVRGLGAGAPLPSPSDFTDFASRISNPSVTMTREAGIPYSQNTGVYWHSGTIGPNLDVYQYPKSAQEESLVFRVNGAIVYQVKVSCGNPVGEYGAITPIPPKNYQLDPSISVSPERSESDTTAHLTSTITNSGTTATDATIQWQSTTFRVAPGAAIPQSTGGASGLAPTQYYGNGATVISSATGQTFQKGATTLSIADQAIGPYPVGTRICYTLSVQPRRHDDGSWQHSPPACVVISKSPKVQVLGGDLLVGRGGNSAVKTAVTMQQPPGGSSTYYGSWSEYGIVASGLVTGMASGSGYAGGSSTQDLCSLSLITFTNASTNGGASACVASNIGQYVVASSSPPIGSRFPISSTTPRVSGAVNLAGLASKTIYTADADFSLTSSAPVAKGKWVVINAPNATVTITGNINYTSEVLSQSGDIPQVVIIAKNIIIADSVTNIDAWLIATGLNADGRINTCGAGGVNEATAVTANNCGARLTVNGPVLANHLLLRRTAGAGPSAAAGDPAEVFNLRPDTYLWATNYTSSAGRLTTVMTRELPPRY